MTDRAEAEDWSRAADTGDLLRALRAGDRDRYLSSLFAPDGRRDGLAALYAFNLELAKVRETVSEPLIGRMRLQFWRDALTRIADGDPPAHFVAKPLAAAVRAHGLPVDELTALVDAREIDLDPLPPADMAALTAYAEGTSSTLIRLALRVLGVDPAVCRRAASDAGVAIALIGLVRALPFQAALGRVTVPADLCVRAGLDPALPAQWPDDADLRPIARPMLRAASARLDAVRDGMEPPPAALPAFLPLSAAALHLKRLRAAGDDPRPLIGRDAHAAVPMTMLWRRLLGSP